MYPLLNIFSNPEGWGTIIIIIIIISIIIGGPNKKIIKVSLLNLETGAIYILPCIQINSLSLLPEKTAQNRQTFIGVVLLQICLKSK